MNITFSTFIKIFFTISLISNSLIAKERALPFEFTALKSPVKASEITLPSSLDKIVKLSYYKGIVVLLNFFATWCPPCRMEMPSLEKFYKKTKDKDVIVIAVAVGQDEDDVFPFMGEITPRPTFPILYDKTSAFSRYWGIQAMPTTFIINKKGYITHYALGARNFEHPKFINMILNSMEW